MRVCGSRHAERGIALVTALLLLLLLLSLSLGYTLLVTSEQKSNGVDLDKTQTFYAAYGAMEQLNAAIGTLFNTTYAPSGAQILQQVNGPTDINGNAAPPVIPGMRFYDPYTGGSGYEISYPTDAFGNPRSTTGLITQGQYQGFQGLITDYTITVSAQSQNYSLTTAGSGVAGTDRYGSEVRLRRSLQTVGIPVFQFGIFSQTDLSFFPGPNFSFGGVVATNGNLYLASGNTLTLSAQTSAFGDIIRDRLSNGLSGGTYQGSYGGTVSQTTSPGTGTYRNLAFTEGSINGGPSGGCPIATGGGTPNANWTTISVSNYNSVLRDGAFGCSRGTGAKNLQLPLVTAGATGLDLIKLPPKNEKTDNPSVYVQRYAVYPNGTNYAMMRIFIADTLNEITDIPEISAGNPVSMTAGSIPTPLVETGAPTVLPPWAAELGNTTSCTRGSLTTNCGDWFKAGQSRLGMGDGTTACPAAWGLPALPTGTGTCGPYIKIEYQDNTSGGVWIDKTAEILSLGTTGRNLSAAATGSNTSTNNPSGTVNPGAGGTLGNCHEPYPNAILRLQRLVDVPSNYNTYGCGYGNPAANGAGPVPIGSASALGTDYIPNMLFDPREALLRDNGPSGAASPCSGTPSPCLLLGGVMYYVELDVTNLSKWFTGALGSHGAAPSGTAGFLVYFSDRRGNQVCAPLANCPPMLPTKLQRKLGNLGWTDFVNPSNASGTPNNSMDTGEDLQGANLSLPGQPPVSMPLDTYGGIPGYGVSEAYPYPTSTTPASSSPGPWRLNGGTKVSGNMIAPGTGNTSTNTGTNLQTLVTIDEARVNPALFFRRALKLTDAQAFSLGSCGSGIPCGLTITSENPVYVEGNYNATGGSCGGSPLTCTYTGTEAPSAVLADAVTLLSKNWNDIDSYRTPYAPGRSTAVTTYYRMAILAGKGVSFPLPSAGSPPQDFGTDGGVHNFLRYIEDWSSANLAYTGSIVSFYFNEQGVGVYKCCNTVYSPPGRGYSFDTNFLTPTLLPPRTPTFRDINTLGFTQLILPTQQ
ncbi:MAG TPA: hypothetical protein VLW54_06045 [Candidatus Acidoferrales bacterium]|nr:hypothetical protein [Candidatus Acidoferrales bacterium]